MQIRVDLFSDTVSKPTDEMRKAMAAAEVGDEQLFEDPSVNKLTKMTAELLGKEDAIYLPSGIMANQISFATHCNPGDLIIMDRTAHPIIAEGGAVAVISGASIHPLNGENGIFTGRQVKEAIASKDYHHPPARVVSVEQTSNLGGGKVWPLARIEEVCQAARDYGLSTHMDGARLFNAVVASGISARDFAAPFDSVWIDLSKGLGAPVGSVLAGSEEFIEGARYWKKRLGGAMRQAGIIAAGGIYALENNIERLADDHANARRLAAGIADLPGISIDTEDVETNIVLFSVEAMSGQEMVEELLARGVRLSMMGRNLLRAVTHLGVTAEDIDYAINVIKEVLS
ncbi:MAG: GntG family PLP-dependent aldolase [Halanaerobium sp.]|nr:GntG family PLP-dependent aldolase [Halanaerobium sp.]